MPARRRSPVTNVVRSTDSSRALYKQRMELQTQVKNEEYLFTRTPTHLRAAKLAALRQLVCEVELQIVGLDLNYPEGE